MRQDHGSSSFAITDQWRSCFDDAQGGVFHLLDFSALKGRVYSNRFIHYRSDSGDTVIENEGAIHDVMNQDQNLMLASGKWSGLTGEEMVVRVTFATEIAGIFDLTDRLRSGMRHYKPTSVPPVSREGVTPAPQALTIK